MSVYVFKLPDLGEGTVEAEIVEWYVKPGDVVEEEDLMVDVMTDKANVEIPAPVSGTVARTSGEPGDMVAVGAELIAFEMDGEGIGEAAELVPREKVAHDEAAAQADPIGVPREASLEPATEKIAASPAIRRRAMEAGVDLAAVPGSGPRGRILRQDLDAYLVGQRAADEPSPTRLPPPGEEQERREVEEIKVIGVRRIIAERMTASKRQIPHFAYVEEVDVTELDALRRHLNEDRSPTPSLTVLPFIGLALMSAVRAFPQCNAHFDADAGVIRRFRHVHLGIATQTPDGLKVPVVHDADRLDLWQLAAQIARIAEAARNNTAKRGDLTGSTITLTSLGRLGGIVSTPVINAPEVAIVGVNKAVKRPVVVDDAVTVRLMMNLSSSFDHRFVDGFDAASLIQHVKDKLEHPATLFV